MSELFKKLKKYQESGVCPMHMPGHKRKVGLYSKFDITEIDDFDNLSNPTGILKKLQDDWAKAYEADRAYISVNGSTGAILSAICGICSYGDKIIMARNCHKSVYNGAKLLNLNCEYIFPDYDDMGIAGRIAEEQIKSAIKNNPDAKLIIITSPTYEGVISDVKGICELAHSKNISVLIDMAHGAHLKFMGQEEKIYKEADMVAVSLHKTLPSLTQTALLLLNGKLIDKNKIKEKLNVFNTSSPSYVLMSSMGDCLDYVKNKKRFKEYEENLNWFYSNTKSLKNLEIKEQDDRGKIVISTIKTNISGKTLLKRLRKEFKIELEMAYDNYALAMTSVCDRKKDFKRLKCALLKIDKDLKDGKNKKTVYPKPQKSEISLEGVKEFIKISNAEGKICSDFLWAYPPGVPIITPGEIIDKETISYFKNIEDTEIYGTYGSDNEQVLVYK